MTDYRDGTRCKCGRAKSSGSRSCRACWGKGRGAQRGRRSGFMSLAQVIDRAKSANLKRGQSIVIEGMRVTKGRNEFRLCAEITARVP